MSISVTLNPGNRQFYNNVWYVGGENAIIDNATANTWISSGIAYVSPNQPSGLVETFPSTAAFQASVVNGEPAISNINGNIQIFDGTNILDKNGRPLLKNIADRCRINETLNAGVKYINSQSGHHNRSDLTLTSIALIVGNYTLSTSQGEIGNGAATSVTASIEYPIGNYQPITFNGLHNGSIPNAGLLLSDTNTLATPIPPGGFYRVKLSVGNANGAIYCAYQDSAQLGDGMYYSGSALGDTSNSAISAGGGSSNPSCVRPLAVLGYSNRPSHLGIGDSRMLAQGDSTASAAGYAGYFERGLSPYFATMTQGVSGDTLANFLTTNNVNRLFLAGYATHIHCEYNVNDIVFNSSALATLQTNLSAFGALFPKKAIIPYTLEPYNSSSDSWATLANQSLTGATSNAKDAVRTAYNDWLRSGAYNVTGLSFANFMQAVDIASVLESSLDSGKWIVNGASGYPTIDGAHATSALNAIAGTPVVFNNWQYT